MEKRDVKFASSGELGLLVLEVLSEIAPENVAHACLAILYSEATIRRSFASCPHSSFGSRCFG